MSAASRNPSDGFSSTAALQDIPLLGYLAHDIRPSIVLDKVHGSIVFRNDAFTRAESDQFLDSDLTLLTRWSLSNCAGNTMHVGAHLWTITNAGHHWLVASGIRTQAHVTNSSMHVAYDYGPGMLPPTSPSFVSKQLVDVDARHAPIILDCTGNAMPSYSSDHIDKLRALDWSKTSIGPMSSWSSELRLAFNCLVRECRPAALYWGDQLTLLYNEAFVPMVLDDRKHLIGLDCSTAWKYLEAWPEYSRHLGHIFALGYQRGESCIYLDQQIFLETSWGIEERFFDYSFVPIVITSGVTAGFYQALTDTTDSFRTKRQDDTLRALKSAVINEVESAPKFWNLVLQGLLINAFDVPFAIAYTRQDHDFAQPNRSFTAENMGSELFVRPCASLRLTVLDDNSMQPTVHDALMSDPFFSICMTRACETRVQQHFHLLNPNLQNLFNDAALDRPFPDKISTLCLLPVCPNGGPPRGVLLLGLNPRRQLDQKYQRFLDAISQEVSSIYRSIEIVKHADEITMIRQKRFDQLASMSTAGLFEIDVEGHLLYTNKRWHEITGCPGPIEKLPGPAPWLPYLDDGYAQGAIDAWDDIIAGKSIGYELRWRGKSLVQSGITGEIIEKDGNWSLATSYMHVPEGHPEMATVMGCLVEINQQKQATEDALDRKRQQEIFVDMTSHEMRNPMSAVLQSADSIVVALEQLMRSLHKPETEVAISQNIEAVKNSLDAAQTIVFCTQHQKRIIDDVLNLSKLNSHLLTLDPCPFQPSVLLKRCANIFKAEVAASNLILRTELHDSYHELVRWVHMDPSRTQQILVNLITNAIKFTAEQVAGKVISLRLGASKTEPTTFDNVNFSQSLQMVAVDGSTLDQTSESDDAIFICFSVQDTGCGMDGDGLDKLFTRFFQAPQRSHVKYGGSGLGLFIARRLTELQGGRIGVASQLDRGSTFAFYIKANTCPRPLEDYAELQSDDPSSSYRVDALPTSQVELQPAAQVSPSRTLHDKAFKDINVLVVEDNLINQKVLAKQLSLLGWNISVANHGQEALEHLERTTHWRENKTFKASEPIAMDVMLLDVEMPVMDGITCVREIRRLEQEGTLTGHIPVIAITANARKEQMDNAKDAGMDGVVSKPFRIPELVAIIRELLSQRSQSM